MDVLFAWLWQGSAIAVAVGLALRWIPRLSAATRHLVWWVTLVCVAVLPLALLSIAALGESLRDDASVASVATNSGSILELPAPPDWACSLALGAWLGVVMLAAVRIGRGVLHVRRLAREAQPMPADREAALRLWTTYRHAGRSMRLRVSNHVSLPCALGLGQATVLIPQRMLTRLADEDLDKIVMHERAHLVRYDDWTRLLQAILTAAFGVHPALHWIGRQIEVEREIACDDLVVQAAGDARAYASCLAVVASTVMSRGVEAAPTLAPGAIRSVGTLERRVRRLLDHRHNGATVASRTLTAATAAVLALAATMLVQAGPVVSFVEGRTTRVDVPHSPAAVAWPSNVDASALSAPAQVPGAPIEQPSAPAARGEPASRGVDIKPTLGERPESIAVIQPAAVHPIPLSEAELQRPGASAEQLVELPATFSVDPGVRPTPVDAAAISGVNTSDAGSAGSERSPWTGVAQAGTNVGAGAKKAGLAIGGFFSRAGQAIGNSF